eukprot:m.168101 g.168101  ORF g.168101 m.168101 type:complete len:478 (-) comp31492_c0_seq1:171-1604(-)
MEHDSYLQLVTDSENDQSDTEDDSVGLCFCPWPERHDGSDQSARKKDARPRYEHRVFPRGHQHHPPKPPVQQHSPQTAAGNEDSRKRKRTEGLNYVQSNVQLAEKYRHTPNPLSQGEVDAVEGAALNALGTIQPILKHLCTIKLVRNERKNFINIRIKKEFVPLMFVWKAPESETRYFFFASINVEPYVNVVAIHPERGRVRSWRDVDHNALMGAVRAFLKKVFVSQETYRYSAGAQSVIANDLKKVLDRAGRSSAAFVLHIRVATQLMINALPVLKTITIDQTRSLFRKVEALSTDFQLVHPLLKFITEKNRQSGSAEFRLQFLSTIFAVWKDNQLYEFHVSDKFEPFVIAIVIDNNTGKQNRLTSKQLENMDAALVEFRNKFGITNETYHYTPYAERMKTDNFVKTGGANMKSKAHSTDFHLKIRISSKMYVETLPIFKNFDFNRIKAEVEPVKYNVSRDTLPWADIKKIIQSEI